MKTRLIVSAIFGIIATAASAQSNITVYGFNLLPWGVGFGFLSLVFAIPFARQETDKTYRTYVELGMLGRVAEQRMGAIDDMLPMIDAVGRDRRR